MSKLYPIDRQQNMSTLSGHVHNLSTHSTSSRPPSVTSSGLHSGRTSVEHGREQEHPATESRRETDPGNENERTGVNETARSPRVYVTPASPDGTPPFSRPTPACGPRLLAPAEIAFVEQPAYRAARAAAIRHLEEHLHGDEHFRFSGQTNGSSQSSLHVPPHSREQHHSYERHHGHEQHHGLEYYGYSPYISTWGIPRYPAHVANSPSNAQDWERRLDDALDAFKRTLLSLSSRPTAADTEGSSSIAELKDERSSVPRQRWRKARRWLAFITRWSRFLSYTIRFRCSRLPSKLRRFIATSMRALLFLYVLNFMFSEVMHLKEGFLLQYETWDHDVGPFLRKILETLLVPIPAIVQLGLLCSHGPPLLGPIEAERYGGR